MNQLDVLNDFTLRVSKRTKTFVIAFFNIVGVKLTKFCFIAVRMVQLLQLIMRRFTIFIVAFLFVTNKMIVLYV